MFFKTLSTGAILLKWIPLNFSLYLEFLDTINLYFIKILDTIKIENLFSYL